VAGKWVRASVSLSHLSRTVSLEWVAHRNDHGVGFNKHHAADDSTGFAGLIVCLWRPFLYRIGVMNALFFSIAIAISIVALFGRETRAFLPIACRWASNPAAARSRQQYALPTYLYMSSDDDSDDDDDDDGWGDESSSGSSSSLEEKAQELRELQQASSARRSPAQGPSTTDEPERDLIIPIFALVSIIGLFGSYGYEMVRLASRGELYLPWNN
jgi:hypothetical protein